MMIKNIKKTLKLINFLTLLQGVCSVLHHEGDRVEFVFNRLIRFENCSLEISKRHVTPFYQNGSLVKSGLSDDQYKRFRVSEKVKPTHIETHVVIQRVSRNDGGTYVCNAFKYIAGEKKLCISESIYSLSVMYLPGKAECSIIPVEIPGEIDVKNNWKWIECRASRGSYPTSLKCYQRSRVAPPVLEVTMSQNRKDFVKKMWMKKEQPIHCCSYDSRKTESECNDFTYPNSSSSTGGNTISEVSSKESTELISTRQYSSTTKPSYTTGHKVVDDDAFIVLKRKIVWSGPVMGIVITLGFMVLFSALFLLMKFFSLIKRQQNVNAPSRGRPSTLPQEEIPMNANSP